MDKTGFPIKIIVGMDDFTFKLIRLEHQGLNPVLPLKSTILILPL
jgi:hypothetical protein